MNAKHDLELDGISELRAAVRLLNGANESFNQRFTAEQLLQLCRMHRASQWDYYPDCWSERQVQEALAGRPPEWDNVAGEPLYAPHCESRAVRTTATSAASVKPCFTEQELLALWHTLPEAGDTAWKALQDAIVKLDTYNNARRANRPPAL